MKLKNVYVAKSLVVNDRNEALILTIGEYRAHPEKSFTPDLPGGLVDPGEDALQAARRELYEETGIHMAYDKFRLVYERQEYFAIKNDLVHKHFYIVCLDHTPVVKLSWEHASCEWVPVTMLSRVSLRPFYREAVDYCLENKLI